MGNDEARVSRFFLSAWLIAPERFAQWAEMPAGNDDHPQEDGLPAEDDIPAVSLLSFY